MMCLKHGQQIRFPAFIAINNFLVWHIFNPWALEVRALAVLHGIIAGDTKFATKGIRYDMLV
jgi:hypothetical protein